MSSETFAWTWWQYKRGKLYREAPPLGPELYPVGLEVKGTEAFKEGRFQDALDAYSLALCYRFDAVTLTNRSQAHIKLAK